MTNTLVHRQFGALGMLMGLSSVVPLVTTLLLSEWIVIKRVLVVGFVPFLINGIIGMARPFFRADLNRLVDRELVQLDRIPLRVDINSYTDR